MSYESIQSSGNSDNNSSNNNNSNNNDSHIIQCGAYGYLHDYIPIDEGTTSVTIRTSYDCEVSDIYAYSAGTLPSSVMMILIFSYFPHTQMMRYFSLAVYWQTMAANRDLMFRLHICVTSFLLNL